MISTLSNSKKWSNGKITHNLHFDGKAHYCEYLQETYRTTLGSVTSYVQVGYYLSNALQQGIFKPHLDPHNPGEYLFPTIGVAGGTRPTPFVDTANDVGYFVSALVLKAPPETNVVAYCKEIMFDDFVQLWAETMGLKARSEVWGVNEFVQAGVPLWQAEEMADFGKYVSVWGWSGGDAEVKSPEECGVDMDKLTDVRQWIQEQDWGL